MVDSYTVSLDELQLDGVIECPYCSKGKSYVYGAKGMQSSTCHICKRIVLWDFDRMKAYQVKARKYAS